ncbi:hypothetical protein [Nocardioides sp.]|uniref:arsenate reductase/protein-tyrosine-phosphatase family protein n=1 Tax=Nocardioides sp. TaxID=35761 RepID=UPI003D0CC072
MKVLFVCTANICRSAYAEVTARHGAAGVLSFSSAGVHGFPAAGMESLMASEAEARGVSSARFRSARLTTAMIDDADLVLTAETRHRQFILEERPVAMRTTFTLGQFARGLDRVDAPSADLIAQVRAQAPTSRPEDDVADPYGRGPDAASRAAHEIDDLLAQILPALELAANAPAV